MTTKDRWLLPEGIEEVLPPQAELLEKQRRVIIDLFHKWGYELVIPPFIEYLHSLLTGTGTDLDLQTFKLTDQLTGRLMGVRADITPQVARIDAHRLKKEEPVRLCYLGTVLHTRPDGFAGSRSPLQVGAELFGHSGIESDVEVILLMLEMLETTGIQNLHIDLGHVGIFRGLARQAGLTEEQEGNLFDALQRKARAEIDDFVTGLAADEKIRSMLAGLIDLNGGAEVLEDARKQLAGASPEVLDSLTNLEQIANTISRKKPAIRLYYDLAELRGYQYQTGVVFAAYVPGHGQEIARGGRYDDIGKVFGRARPATGFSADIKTLISLGPQQTYQQTGIFVSNCEDPAVQAKVAELRAAGERVVCALPGQYGGAQEMGCDRVLEKRDGHLTVAKIKDK